MSQATADLRAFMSAFPTGVAVVSTLDADRRPRGMTCSSLCSVALAPATLLVCLRSESPTLAAALERGTFAVNLLHAAASSASRLFSSAAPDRFDRIPWHLPVGACGPHLTTDAHAIADCLVSHTLDVGDHTVVFAEVERTTLSEGAADPLLYGQRRYASWSERAALIPGARHVGR
ncbi:flavin reductase [Streptomyces sp. NPDC008092]|uniref:flavin reductase family protein n=1 Tax=Streptomyces sp. NPDC008092 TaxID=3364808 RepID=UPI0036EB85D1